MNTSHWALLLGALLTVAGLLALAAPSHVAPRIKGFARHVWTGRMLAVWALAWAGWALYSMPLEMLLPVRMWIPLVVLACIPLTWFWMPELLSCRAWGGLLVLFPHPLLMATRSHPSEWRLVLVVFAYVCIGAGMTLILYPYYLRRWMDWLAAQSSRLGMAGVSTLALGALFLKLGLTVLRP